MGGDVIASVPKATHWLILLRQVLGLVSEHSRTMTRLDLGVVYENRTYPIEVKLWKGEQYYQQKNSKK